MRFNLTKILRTPVIKFGCTKKAYSQSKSYRYLLSSLKVFTVSVVVITKSFVPPVGWLSAIHCLLGI